MLGPAIALLNRFNFSGKFAITAAVITVPIVYLLYISVPPLLNTYQTAHQEAKGIHYIQNIQPVLLAAQQHRGLSAAWHTGDAAAEPKVKKVAVDVEQALQTLNTLAQSAGKPFKDAPLLKAITEKWAPLANEASGTPPAQSFSAHTSLVNDILDMSTHVAANSGLTLDPEVDSYYLQESIVNQAWPMIEALGKTRGKTSGILAHQAITPDEKAQISSMTGQIQLYAKNLAVNLNRAMEYNPALREWLGPLLKAVQDAVKQSVELTMKEAVGETFSMASTDYFTAATQPIEATVKLTSEVTTALVQILEERRSHNLTHMIFSLVFTGAIILFTLYIILGMRAGILTAVREVHATSTALAAGDLTREAKVPSQDELGKIAMDVNHARHALARLIQNAKSAAEQVAIASREVAAGSQLIAQATNQQSESISSAAASVEQLTVSVSHTADQTQDANASAVEAGHMSTQGQTVANMASQEMNAIAQAVQEAARRIEGLNTRTDEISGIVQVLKDIADQTNLLALNAAIEAARAGEQGRGFAVVADEVRKLAERTGRATAEIGNKIGAIQNEARQAVIDMDASSSKAVEGERSVGETARMLTSIHDAADNVRDKVAEITSAAIEQRAASTEIAQNVERIAQMVEQNSASSEEVSTTAGHLGDLAAGLKAELDQFKV
jgi:methyl-accepting chemotaxis protein